MWFRQLQIVNCHAVQPADINVEKFTGSDLVSLFRLVLQVVPELSQHANLDLQIAFNLDRCCSQWFMNLDGVFQSIDHTLV